MAMVTCLVTEPSHIDLEGMSTIGLTMEGTHGQPDSDQRELLRENLVGLVSLVKLAEIS